MSGPEKRMIIISRCGNWKDKQEIELTNKTPVNGITDSIQGKLDEVFDKNSSE